MEVDHITDAMVAEAERRLGKRALYWDQLDPRSILAVCYSVVATGVPPELDECKPNPPIDPAREVVRP